MYEFDQLEWGNKSLRGSAFGFHGKSYVYLEGREAIIHVRTGSTSELDVRFIIGASIPGFGPRVDAVFAEEGGEPLEFGSMYMSEDGIDPLSKKRTGHPLIPREPRENAALKPNTDYYLTLTVLDQGHPSWVPKIKLTYSGTDYEGQHQIAQSTRDGVSMVIEGVAGTWTQDE